MDTPKSNQVNHSETSTNEQLKGQTTFEDFLAYRSMLIPTLIVILSYLLMIGCIGVGIVAFTEARQDAQRFVAFAWILGGPLVVRIAAELILVTFRINQTLSEIRRLLIDSSSR